MNEQHAMILENTDSSGVEAWYCPTCGRRILINWRPRFKRTVIEAGDAGVSHGGFKGGQQMADLMASSKNELSSHQEVDVEDSRLAPWEAWLEESGFEDLWDSDAQ